MARPIDEAVASPPDDGGELGNFTRPGDLLSVGDDEGDRRTPALSVDPTRTNTIDRDEHPRHGLGAWTGTVLIAAICAAAVAIVYLLAGG